MKVTFFHFFISALFALVMAPPAHADVSDLCDKNGLMTSENLSVCLKEVLDRRGYSNEITTKELAGFRTAAKGSVDWNWRADPIRNFKQDLSFFGVGIHRLPLGLPYVRRELDQTYKLTDQDIRKLVAPVRNAILNAPRRLSLAQTLELVLKTFPNRNLIWSLNALALVTVIDIADADKLGSRSEHAAMCRNLLPIPETEADPCGGLYHFWGYFYRVLLFPDLFHGAAAEIFSRGYERNDPPDRSADALAIETAHRLLRELSRSQ